MIHTIQNMLTHFAACNAAGDGGFFEFPTWYKYLNDGVPAPGEACAIAFIFPTDIPLVMLALVEILLRIAGMVAIAYVIYGGIQYVVSQGESDRIARAKGTIINALAGLVIATLAVAFVSFIGNRIG
jgi:hypothetical protein